MRILILSDVHANLVALDACLTAAAAPAPLDGLWCLGDSVGYGPQPGEALARLREHAATMVAGNHDLAAAGNLPTAEFNPAARAAIEWTQRRLEPEVLDGLRALPDVIVQAEAETTLVHGSLRAPAWEYLMSARAAHAHLALQRTPYGLVGHTHVPLLFEEPAPGAAPAARYLEDGATVALGERRLILNPGSVGQPRDGDPRAAYGILDTGSGAYRQFRVPYDIAAVQARMASAGLPQALIARLAAGR